MVVLMLVGIGLIGVLRAIVASSFVEEQADEEKAAPRTKLDRIEAMLAQALGRSTALNDSMALDGNDLTP